METLQRTANRGSISTGYDIDNSLKFEADNTESLTKAAATGGDRTKATLSLWCKRTELTNSEQVILFLTGVNGNKYTSLGWGTGDEINFHYYNSGTYPYNFLTDRVFRDMSAWYHIVVAVDTTQSTGSDRVKFYVNGVQETSFSTEDYPDQNIDTPFNNDSATYPMEIGNDTVFSMGGEALSGYLADYYLIDGQQLAPTEFGEFDEDSGIWIPKAYTGTFGSNGFYLDFADASDLGDDESGNGNDFTEVNITSADQATDTPTNNFATLNPLWVWTYGMGISDGATKVANIVTAWGGAKSSIGVTNGKWYWEHSSFSGSDTFFGIQNSSGTTTQAYEQAYTVGLFMNANSDIYFYDPSGRTESFSFTFAVSDVWGIALDLDGNTISFYRNGSIVNSAVALDGIVGNGELFPFVSHYGGGLNSRINLGGYTGSTISSAETDENGYGTFEYAPPSGYYALCTKNLAEFG
jgi:hypothetical protein